MSALGHKRTFCNAGAMSALHPIADIKRSVGDAAVITAPSTHATANWSSRIGFALAKADVCL
jgi:hypothetical protein